MSNVACQNSEQILAFEPSKIRSDGEVECCRMLDLLVLTEMVVFSLLVQDQNTATIVANGDRNNVTMDDD